MTSNQVAFYKARNDREHNIATEKLSAQANQIAQQNANTQERHYTVSDAENQRSHLANESINRFNASIASRNADTNAKNASINAWVAKTKDDANAINAFKAQTDRNESNSKIALNESQAYKTQREGDVVYLNTASKSNLKTLLGFLPSMSSNWSNNYTNKKPVSGKLEKRR